METIVKLDFMVLKAAIAAQFEMMHKHTLLRANVEKDTLWETYINAFPAGTNPTFRERTEHDCSCCKGFIRSIGNMVAVIDGKLVTVWDVKVPKEPAYQKVADAMSKLVSGAAIKDIFLHDQPTAGTDKNFEELTSGTMTWRHFFVNIPRRFVKKGVDIPTALGVTRETQGVFQRSLETITLDAVDTVLDLIAQNSLYRGAEHKYAVTEFRKGLSDYSKLKTARDREIYTWEAATLNTLSQSILRIKNTSIGTLLVDLSEGTNLEDAVKKFEAMVAPANYKRTTALITPAMIKKAKEKLQELGLTSALERRYATINDITINNILFADRAARKVINGDVFDDLMGTTSGRVSSKSMDSVEEITIDKFVTDVLPRIESMEVLFENKHAGNLVSLIAPTDPTSGMLFKWPNRFSWSYTGDVADSIKERVKKAGGRVDADLCCRLAWDNSDDLDLHLKWGANHIYYGDRGIGGGMLDVDANGINGLMDNPVENIYFADRSRLRPGVVYELYVNQFNRRSSTDTKGFDAEIDFLGKSVKFSFPRRLRGGENVLIAKFSIDKNGALNIIESLPTEESTRSVWNLPTQTFHKVNVMMLSPNFWDEKAVGNKHFFFMLDGCKNEGTARGFFNEFLKNELDEHRKVFEMVGSKMQAGGDDQLSGLGFSSTQRNTLTVRVKGSFTRTLKIVF